MAKSRNASTTADRPTGKTAPTKSAQAKAAPAKSAPNGAPEPVRMPAEWEPHDGTWIGWPHNAEDWPGKFAPVPWVYAEIVRHLSVGETVHICVQNARLKADAAAKLELAGVDAGRVRFHLIPTDRVWLRDSGPIFALTHGEPGRRTLYAQCFRFNGWAKYDNHLRDARVPYRVFDTLPPCGLSEYGDGSGDRMVLEGGSIDVNGAGSILTTEECLLSKVQRRNPAFARKDYEAAFDRMLGARHTIWLGKGIAGDDTHGHVDDLARFVSSNTVVVVQEPNPRDPNHKPLAENRERLQDARDQDGRKLEVVPLPMPAPLVFEGQRLPASYANFYIGNEAVLVPTFNDPADRVALGTLSDLFPDRRVVGIHAVDLVWGLGTLHCLTQQQPRP
jgi:agmatine deiminase